jgi:hypothetical protein
MIGARGWLPYSFYHAEGRALDIGLMASRPEEKSLRDNLLEMLVKGATLATLMRLFGTEIFGAQGIHWYMATRAKIPT